MKRAVYAQDLNGGRRFIGHATSKRGANIIGGKYLAQHGKAYLSQFGRWIVPTHDVNEGK